MNWKLLSTMKRTGYFLLLFFIICLGSYLRFVGVFTNSFAFTYDVGRDMLAVAQIVYHHKIPLIGFTTGMPGIFYGPWWYYILTIPFAISSGNPQFIDGFMAVSGIATIIVLYFFGQKISGKSLGLILAFLVAISPSLISISVQIWNPNIAPLLVGVLFLLTTGLIRKPTIWTYFFIGILFGLLIDTEIVFGLLLFVGYVIGSIILQRKKVLTWKLLFSLFGLLIMFAPRIVFELRHQLLMTHTIIKLLSQSHSSVTPFSWTGVLEKLPIFFNSYVYTLTGNSTLFAGFLLLLLLSIFIVFFKKITGVARTILLLSLIIITTFVIGIGFFSHDIFPHYLVGLPVFYVVVTGILLETLRKQIKSGTIIVGILLVFIFLFTIQPVQLIASLQKPVFTGDASVYRNQVAIIDYVYQQAHGQPFNYAVYTPPVFDYPYQYLFAWYGKIKYHYVPSTGHERLFFVIIEPDTQHPNLLYNWLKVRAKDGKIIKQIVMPSGVTVQTRIH